MAKSTREKKLAAVGRKIASQFSDIQQTDSKNPRFSYNTTMSGQKFPIKNAPISPVASYPGGSTAASIRANKD